MSITKTREVFSLPNVHYAIFYKYLIDEVLHINTRFSSHKISFNAVSKINFQYYKYCNS